ncbi:CAP domain-containing protein [Pseudogracilibacillus sp. SO30301A]|uniref:CAP domain-containing protein n=1 Tax=Pseudogracilibacillus sp. SO30301A TaxID=3098291 RepID=UPI00300DCDDF
MFKKYRIIVAMLIVGLVSTGFGQSVGASAQAGDTESQTDKFIYQGKIDKDNYRELESFLENCLAKWNIQWNKTEKTPKEEQPEEQPAPEEVEQPEEQPAPEEVEQPEEQPAPEEVEQPEEQPAPEEVEQPAQPAPEENVTPEKPENNDSGQLSQYEQQVVELTNQERAKNGLQPLQVDNELSKVAREKSRDMQVNNYFDHNSPTYGSPFDMMKAYGINYRAAGENIAMGQRTPQEVVNAWMNSPGHRENILNSSFTHIGVGYVEQGNYWTQQFIGK